MNSVKKIIVCAVTLLSFSGLVTVSSALQVSNEAEVESVEMTSQPEQQTNESAVPDPTQFGVICDGDGNVVETLPISDAAEQNDKTVEVYAEGLIPVFAQENGVVAHYGLAQYSFGHSPTVCLKLEDGSYAYYYNLLTHQRVRDMDVNILYGEAVEKGQLIGYTYDEARYEVTNKVRFTKPWGPAEAGFICPEILIDYVEMGYTLPECFQKILDGYYDFIEENPDKDHIVFCERWNEE